MNQRVKKLVYLLSPWILAISTFAGGQTPNILFLLTDDQRPDTLSCYDATCPLPTPNIDRLAKDGVRFTQGFATTPICSVSRASILTGRYGCNIGVTAFHGSGARMSAEVVKDSYNAQLKRAGYYTGQIGKLHAYGSEIKTVIDYYESKHGSYAEIEGQRIHHAKAMTLLTEDFLDHMPDGKPSPAAAARRAVRRNSSWRPDCFLLLFGWIFQAGCLRVT
jgi:arylsulfatase A-like enzyme